MITRTPVIIPPPLPWWHGHRKGQDHRTYVWVLCTDRFCGKPYDLEKDSAPAGEAGED